MCGQKICEKVIELLGERYIVYLKKVPTRLGLNGEAEFTTVKAFVKKL